MTNKQEIKLFEKAKSLLMRGYGRNPDPHKGGIAWDCSECRASIGVAVIDKHLELLRWDSKNQNKKTNYGINNIR